MFDKYKKYLIIDSNDIDKSILKVKREMIANDSLHLYEQDGVIKSKEVFDKYEIPSQYQKIIITENNQILNNRIKFNELCTGYSFFLKDKHIVETNNIKIINEPINDNPFVLLPLYTIMINKIKYIDYQEVINFYQELSDNGYLKDYLKCLNELFELKLDIDLIYELREKEKKRRKVLKIYKKGNTTYLV